jgi:hypothetical protein
VTINNVEQIAANRDGARSDERKALNSEDEMVGVVAIQHADTRRIVRATECFVFEESENCISTFSHDIHFPENLSVSFSPSGKQAYTLVDGLQIRRDKVCVAPCHFKRRVSKSFCT